MALMKAEQNTGGERSGKVRQGFADKVTLGLSLALSTRKKIAEAHSVRVTIVMICKQLCATKCLCLLGPC